VRLISSAMAIAAVAVLLLVAAACSNDSSATPSPTPTAALTPTPGGTATPTPDATALAGAPITPSDAAAYLPARADENHVWAPIGGFGGFVIVGKEPDKSLGENAPWAYYVWNPADGSLAPEWTGEPGKPETVVDSYYDWIVTERRGAGGTPLTAIG